MYDETKCPTEKPQKGTQFLRLEKESMYIVKEYLKERNLIHTLSVLEVEWGTNEMQPEYCGLGGEGTLLDKLITTSIKAHVAHMPSSKAPEVEERLIVPLVQSNSPEHMGRTRATTKE